MQSRLNNKSVVHPYILCGSDIVPVLVWANTSKSSWAGGGLQLGRELRVLLTLSAPMSGREKNPFDCQVTLQCKTQFNCRHSRRLCNSATNLLTSIADAIKEVKCDTAGATLCLQESAFLINVCLLSCRESDHILALTMELGKTGCRSKQLAKLFPKFKNMPTHTPTAQQLPYCIFFFFFLPHNQTIK